MNQAESKKPILEGHDILFECRQCGKSLTIDSRGAGLNVPCPQCGSDLVVPIPEGFDLAELDKEITSADTFDADVQIKAPALDKIALVSSDESEQIKALKSEIEALRAQQQYPVQRHADMLKTVRDVSRQAGELRRALDDLSLILDALTGPQTDETQKLG